MTLDRPPSSGHTRPSQTAESPFAQLLRPLRWLRQQGARGDLARGTLAAFSIRVGGIGLAFAAQILIARTLGLTAFGEYAYVLSWLMVLSLVARLGLDTAGLRFIAAYRTSESWALLRGFLQASQRLASGSALVVALLLAGMVALLRAHLTPSLVNTAWIACLALPLLVLLHMQSAALRAFKQIVPALFSVEILRPALLGLAVGALYLGLRQPIGARAAMLAHLAAISIALAVSRRALLKTLPDALNQQDPIEETGRWIRVSVPLLLVSGFHIILSQTDMIMVGALLNTDRAGIYVAATRLAQLVPLCLIAAAAIAAPTIAELWTVGDRPRLQRLLTVSARIVFLATLPLVAGLVLAGRFALGLFGSGFEQAYIPLLILTAGHLISVSTGTVGYVMTMTGLEGQAAKIMAGVAAANLVLNAVLIPLLGIRGAALATAISTVSWNLAMLVTIRRERGLDSSFLPMR